MANYLVMTVKAVDNDTGDNGKIKYHLQVKIIFQVQNVKGFIGFYTDLIGE